MGRRRDPVVWGTSIGTKRVVCAAYTKREAAHAMNLSMYAFNQYASETGNVADVAAAMANIGIALERPIDQRNVAVGDWTPVRVTYVPVTRTTKAERQARADEYVRQRRHRDESKRACVDVIERIRPLLTELGVHAQTVVVGEDVDHGGRVGVLIPAEVAEMLVGKAVELETIMTEMELR